MDRLFLDANVLFSAAYRAHAGLLRLWKLKNATLRSSRYALEEARINLDEEAQRIRLHKLAEVIHLVEASPTALPRGISLPEKDTPILLGAIEAHATHLLTGDVRPVGPYFGKTIEGVIIMLPGEYLRLQNRDA
jgi:predicted nucleic acid-binding protein